MEYSDALLGEFANGNITMEDGPIQFRNTRQMHKVLDIAASIHVVRVCISRKTCSCS